MILINGEAFKIGNDFINRVSVTLPPISQNTLRVEYIDGTSPKYSEGVTLNQVSTYPNIWDVTCPSPYWGENSVFHVENNLLKVIGGNTSSAISFNRCFQGCRNLKSVDMFDTSNVMIFNQAFQGCESLTSVANLNLSSTTECHHMFNGCVYLSSAPSFNTINALNMESMFLECWELQSIPQVNTTNATAIDNMFRTCPYVENGILEFYNRVSTQANIPSHSKVFYECGTYSPIGSAEQTQIPSDWK